jgi:hypothetical protein
MPGTHVARLNKFIRDLGTACARQQRSLCPQEASVQGVSSMGGLNLAESPSRMKGAAVDCQLWRAA